MDFLPSQIIVIIYRVNLVLVYDNSIVKSVIAAEELNIILLRFKATCKSGNTAHLNVTLKFNVSGRIIF